MFTLKKDRTRFLTDCIPYEAVQHCLIVYKEQESWVRNFVENTFTLKINQNEKKRRT